MASAGAPGLPGVTMGVLGGAETGNLVVRKALLEAHSFLGKG